MAWFLSNSYADFIYLSLFPCLMDSLIFVGPRGSGKSEVGKTVACRAGLPFVDADTEFVSRYGGISGFVGRNG